MSSERPTIGAIVQARLGSQRLPGKVLRTVGGKPLMQYTLERIGQAPGIERIVVATSSDPNDDSLADWCRHFGVDCVRGALHDVAGRFVEALHRCPFDAFVRISADSPLIDPRLIERGIEVFHSKQCDIATNVFPKTYPNGESVEVICTATFLAAYPRFEDDSDREHVTPFLYRHADEFRIENFTRTIPCRDCEFAVDTPAHFARFERMIAAMTRPHCEYGIEELIELDRTLGSVEPVSHRHADEVQT